MKATEKEVIVRVRNIVLDGSPEIDSQTSVMQRICGYLNVPDFCKLMLVADNKVNPRNARNNPVVRQIRETLATSPELFWIKSRGILISTNTCTRLERGRVKISFNNPEMEGIMDGGHNTLAIASFLLNSLLNVRFQEANEWHDCKEYWQEHYSEIEQALGNAQMEGVKYDFLIPVEIIAPLNASVPGVTNEQIMRSEEICESYLPDICAARNTNVQITETAKSNQLGLYELLKEYVPDAEAIVWKAGDGKGIKCEDVVSLACLPLNRLLTEGGLGLQNSELKFNAINVYSQKGKCVDFYKKLIMDKNVSVENRSKYEVKHAGVKSALKMVADIMRFFDRVYILFPEMYNRYGNFGRITPVKMNPSGVHFKTTDIQCDRTYPDGFIYPLVCALTTLMRYNAEKGLLEWSRKPGDISDKELSEFGYQETYVEVVKALNYDPNRVGKSRLAYNTAEQMFRLFLNK